MIWKKSIHDSLTSCSAICNEFATECSNSEDTKSWYRSIFLSSNCAHVCLNFVTLYVRGSEKTRLLAKACIELYEECVLEVSKFNSDCCQQVYAICQQTICSCVAILDMASLTERESKKPVVTPASLFYGIDHRETLYN